MSRSAVRALRRSAGGRRVLLYGRDMPLRFRMLRNKRIEPVLSETRSVVACMGNDCGRCSGDEKNSGEVLLHDSLHEETAR
ncbi:hypothetical protein BG57_06470 [Caballeronia grimmiae]|uniref:Uncharacterized protein n=1 Tax=Caballeronia grimmiae TaxID=1071679 RepID=A0A069P1S0_9BURK|nr:hypothetical protein BG57_06470 [Caballeronia grimmiae]